MIPRRLRTDKLCRKAPAGSPERRACCASSRRLVRRRIHYKTTFRLIPEFAIADPYGLQARTKRGQKPARRRLRALFSRQAISSANIVWREGHSFSEWQAGKASTWISAGFAISCGSWRPEASAAPPPRSMSPNRRSARPSNRWSVISRRRCCNGQLMASLRRRAASVFTSTARFSLSSSNAPNSTSESRWSSRRVTSPWVCRTASGRS